MRERLIKKRCLKIEAIVLQFIKVLPNVDVGRLKLLSLATIGDKIVETLSLNGVLRKTKESQCTLPLSLLFKFGVFVVFYR